MISESTNLTDIWSHARNVRADFIQLSRFEEPTEDTSTPSYSFDLFGGGGYYYYYENDNTSEITTTTELPNEEIDSYGKYYDNSDSTEFIDQENIERNYRNMYRLLKSTYNGTFNTKNINSISENVMLNGALIFVFLNSNPNTGRRNLVKLFDRIIEEKSYKSILMTNQVIKKYSTIEKDIATNFFTKIASVFGFQYNLPRNSKNPLTTTNFSINNLVQGFL